MWSFSTPLNSKHFVVLDEFSETSKVCRKKKSQCLLALDELVAVHGSLVKFQLRIRFFKAIEAKASTVSTFNCFQTRSWDIMGVISSSFSSKSRTFLDIGVS